MMKSHRNKLFFGLFLKVLSQQLLGFAKAKTYLRRTSIVRVRRLHSSSVNAIIRGQGGFVSNSAIRSEAEVLSHTKLDQETMAYDR
jgi:hypothetical protein